CAYTGGCEKFVSGCDATCPTPKEYPHLAPSAITASWNDRRELVANTADLVAISPSLWLKRQAQSGLWRNARVEHITNGLDLSQWLPRDKLEARRRLGIGIEDTVGLFVAANVHDRRKGFDILQ